MGLPLQGGSSLNILCQAQAQTHGGGGVVQEGKEDWEGGLTNERPGTDHVI